MKFESLLTTLVVIHELINAASGVRWLSIGTLGSSHGELTRLQSDTQCETLSGLVGKQRKLCRKHFDIMAAVQAGARDAIDECQHQFRARRWNCSTALAATSSVFGKVVSNGTRETAFVHAISSAGVAHAVTRACSTGTLERCGCDRTLPPAPPSSQFDRAPDRRTERGAERGAEREADPRAESSFEWAGCSDNINYGNAFAKTFVDAREKVKGNAASRALMNLHNNNAGRKTLEDHMRVQCKCHGVSGSCELKTCWRALPSFRDVGDALRLKFDGATEVEQRRVGSRRELVHKHDQFKPHSDADLVYLDASPDFCERDSRTGSLGTQGRLCSRTSRALDGCELMCCGRGFHTRRKNVTERCHCKFHWCCSVKCQKCRREMEEYICR